MKALILAAGYATRLHPLTANKAKALLPIHDKLMIEYILEELNQIKEIDEIYVVTNERFYTDFVSWAETTSTEKKITVINDNTTQDTNKLGAVGDIQFVIEKMKIEDELLIVAGDNLFTYSLQDYIKFFREKESDCVCVQQCKHGEDVRQFGVAILNEEDLIVDLEEKPENPKSDIVVFATYLYQKDTIPLFKKYLEAGNPPDAPGNFPAWLYQQKKVYGYTFVGDCYDIGTPESYEEVCAIFAKQK